MQDTTLETPCSVIVEQLPRVVLETLAADPVKRTPHHAAYMVLLVTRLALQGGKMHLDLTNVKAPRCTTVIHTTF